MNRESSESPRRPCWEVTSCPEAVRNDCPAYRFPDVPCWQIEGTYCKWNGWGTKGDDNSICRVCGVYREYHEEKGLIITLRGYGIRLLVK